MTSETTIPVGYVRRAHGIGGDVVIRGMVADASDRFVVGRSLLTSEVEPRTLVINEVRIHKGDFLVAFESIADKTTADALVGLQFVIPVEDRRTLDEDEWWVEDLVGLAVVSDDGTAVGTVVGATPGAAQDRLSVKTPEGVEFEVPLVDELVPEVDLTRGVVVVDLPEGLIPD